MLSNIYKEITSLIGTCYIKLCNLTVTICRPYIPALLLGPSAGLNSVRYNNVLDSTSYVKILVSNTILGSSVCIKNTLLGSTSRTIITVLVE